MDIVTTQDGKESNFIVKMYSYTLKRFSSLVAHFEQMPMSLSSLLITFFSCLVIRDMIESFTQRDYNYLNADTFSLATTFFHFATSFVTIVLLVGLLVHFISSTPIYKVYKFLLPVSCLLFIAPVIDFLVSGGAGYNLAYLKTDVNLNLLLSYLTYFGSYEGATIGIRVEVFFVVSAVFLYCQCKSVNFVSSLFAAWLTYTFIFIWGATPFVLEPLLNLFSVEFNFQAPTFSRYFMIINFMLLVVLAFRANKKMFAAFFVEIPWQKVLYYQLMLLLGVCYALNQSFYSLVDQFSMQPAIVSDLILLSFALFAVLMHAMVVNNINDIEIDKVSNVNRILVKRLVSASSYANMGYVFLALSLTYTVVVGTQAAFVILFIASSYYVYSSYPLRLKRIPVFSKLVISANSLVLVVLGYWLVRGSVVGLPPMFAAVFLVGGTLSSNFIDLKDVKGDAVGNIRTLPILIGLNKAKFLIALATFATYLALGLVIDQPMLLYLLAAAGLVQAILLTRKDYSENRVMFLHNAGLVVLCLTLLG